MAYLLLYIDDIVLTASSSDLLRRIIDRLSYEFAMMDLGALHHFLSISVPWSSDGLHLSQRQYAIDLLQRADIAECHPTATPVDSKSKLSATTGAPGASLQNTEPCWRLAVSHADSARHCLCHSTSLPLHAQPTRAISCSDQAHSALCEVHPRRWSTPQHLQHVIHHGRQLGFLVFKTADHKCGGGAPSYCSRSC